MARTAFIVARAASLSGLNLPGEDELQLAGRDMFESNTISGGCKLLPLRCLKSFVAFATLFLPWVLRMLPFVLVKLAGLLLLLPCWLNIGEQTGVAVRLSESATSWTRS